MSPARVTTGEAKVLGYRCITTDYGDSDSERKLMARVIYDQRKANAEYLLVIGSTDNSKTSIWIKQPLIRNKQNRTELVRDVYPTGRGPIARKR